MNAQTKTNHPGVTTPVLLKKEASAPAFTVTGRDTIVMKAGTVVNGIQCEHDVSVMRPDGGFEAGADYAISLATGSSILLCSRALTIPEGDAVLGGFHFAPGGNAAARAGGDDVPAINPCSVWDVNFRPACPDPCGMAFIEIKRFWCDIYLTGADHLAGTSRFGVTIADGDDCPQNPEGGRFDVFDYKTAERVMAHHGKSLLSLDEFFAAAFGVTERSSCDGDPKVTKLDAPRTSRFGVMQATGSMWAWGHDGDPDVPRASFFGGSWFGGGSAGSRSAALGSWPENSFDSIGARGRSDHLQLG